MAMESQYLKTIFMSRQRTLTIWGATTLEKKGPVYFLIKEGRMILQIYVDQIIKQLDLPFYNELKEEREFVIQIHDDTCYYTLKFIDKFRR